MVFVNCFSFFLSFYLFSPLLTDPETPLRGTTPTTTTLFRSRRLRREKTLLKKTLKNLSTCAASKEVLPKKISHKCQNFTRWLEPKKSAAKCCTEAEKMRIPEVSFCATRGQV
jgi:hypothetical protein